MYRRMVITMCALLCPVIVTGAGETGPALVPQPASIEVRDGRFAFTADTYILIEPGNAEVRGVAEWLAGALAGSLGRPMRIVDFDPRAGHPGDHVFLSTRNADATLGPEGYELEATERAVAIVAPTTAGLARGGNTLRQLLAGENTADTAVAHTTAARDAGRFVPGVKIRDWPRYRWRGMLLDCGRHFMPKEFVLRYIDLLAYHRMNVLHWHLTEDQGWRVEIRRYPKLTEVGAWRRATRPSEGGGARYGGFYTQADIREVVEYARQRHITVVPEIELPGHCQAALASYPELSCTGGPFEVRTEWGISDEVYCAGNDRVFEFLEGVLTEVMELFPSEYIHIGGDEVPKVRWQACPKCQARMKAEGLKDEKELQSWFIRRVEKFLNAHGRRLIGWDEILEGGLAPNATVQSWRGMDGALAAARAGHDVICSPTSHCYLDYPQLPDPAAPPWMAVTPLEKTYAFEPTPAELTPAQARHILGAEGNMWTEQTPPERVDGQVFPRLCAIAELTWSPRAACVWADFQRRMRTHYARLDALGVTYFIPPPRGELRTAAGAATALPISTQPTILPPTGGQVTLESPSGIGEVRYTLDHTDPTASARPYTTPIEVEASMLVKARVFLPDGRAGDVAEFRFGP